MAAVALLLALSAVPAEGRAEGRAEGWSPWREVAIDMMTGPAVTSWEPGRLDLFAVGWDLRLHRRTFADGAWQPWETLGAWIYSDPPVAASSGPGRIDVLNYDVNLYNQRHRSFANGVWNPWKNLPEHPKGIGSAAMTSSEPGRLDVFGTPFGPAGVQHLTFAGGTWDTWKPVGPKAAQHSLAAVSPAPGRIDLFRRMPDDTVVHRGFAGAWWPPHNIGGAVTSKPAAASWGPGRLDVFARSKSGTLTHTSRTAGTWSGWEDLGGSVAGAPAAVSWGPGRIDVFVRTATDRLLHRTFGS